MIETIHNRLTAGRLTITSLIALGLALLLFAAAPVTAQPGPDDSPKIDKKIKGEIIDSVSAALNKYYVFPDMAKKMEKFARDQLKKGAYDTLNTTATFARALSADLEGVCHDRHFGMRYVPPDMMERQLDTTNQTTRAENIAEAEYTNFGFDKVERLPSNIGYLKFNGFSGYAEAGPTAIAAMNFLGHVDALIIDLRENGGGSPNMIQILSSYFFDEPTHLNTFYIRESDSLQQFWTTNYVVGPRLDSVDLYILTSSYTFSAAEEFTYNLKNLGRATIVGETTGGGAHPVAAHFFKNLLVGVRVPFGKAINPITGTNWEGTGIEPNIKVPADQALDAAQMDALKKLREKAPSERHKARIDWQIASLNAKLNPVTVDNALLQKYAGSYGPRQVMLEDGVLYYQREGRPKFKMTPMTDDTFYFEDLPYFRLQFTTDEAGKVTGVTGLYDDGHTDANPRD